MADFTRHDWNDWRIKIVPNGDDIRSIIGILPYFWNNEMVLDLQVWPKRKFKSDETWSYSWELIGLDGELIKSGADKIEITKKEYRKHKNARKPKALMLGYLHPNKHYQILFHVKNSFGDEDVFSAGTFTIKDKDEFQMQLLIFLFGIFFALIMAMLGRGCD